jgi:hypothetical protein
VPEVAIGRIDNHVRVFTGDVPVPVHHATVRSSLLRVGQYWRRYLTEMVWPVGRVAWTMVDTDEVVNAATPASSVILRHTSD